MSMPDPQPMDPVLLAELQDDISERRCGVAYGMALALQDLSNAHDYWVMCAGKLAKRLRQSENDYRVIWDARKRERKTHAEALQAARSRAADMERERDEARRAVCRLEAKEHRTVPASIAEAHGWGYLYPESEACTACGHTEDHKMSCHPHMREGDQ